MNFFMGKYLILVISEQLQAGSLNILFLHIEHISNTRKKNNKLINPQLFSWEDFEHKNLFILTECKASYGKSSTLSLLSFDCWQQINQNLPVSLFPLLTEDKGRQGSSIFREESDTYQFQKKLRKYQTSHTLWTSCIHMYHTHPVVSF